MEQLALLCLTAVLHLLFTRLTRRLGGGEPLQVFTHIWYLAIYGYLFVDRLDGFEEYLISVDAYIYFLLIHGVYFFSWMLASATANSLLHVSSSNFQFSFRGIHNRNIFRITTILGAIGLANNFLNVMNAGGPLIYFTLPLREVELIFGANRLFNYLYFCNIFSLIVLPQVSVEYKFSRVKTISFLLYFVLALSLHGVKGTLIFSIVAFYFSVKIVDRDKAPQVGMYVGALSVGFFLLVTFLRLYNEGGDLDKVTSDAFVSIILILIKYFSTGLVNAALEIERAAAIGLGGETFASVTDVTCSLGKLFCANQFADQANLNLWDPAYNTGTFIREYVRDFGFFGMYVCLVIQAIIFAFLYSIALKNLRTGFVVRAVIILMHFGVFFSNHFLKIQYLFMIVLAVALMKFSRRLPIGPAPNSPETMRARPT